MKRKDAESALRTLNKLTNRSFLLEDRGAVYPYRYTVKEKVWDTTRDRPGEVYADQNPMGHYHRDAGAAVAWLMACLPDAPPRWATPARPSKSGEPVRTRWVNGEPVQYYKDGQPV